MSGRDSNGRDSNGRNLNGRNLNGSSPGRRATVSRFAGTCFVWATLLAATAPFLAAAQAHGGPDRKPPERLLKETRDDGSLVLDESGLTRTFEQIKKILRSISTAEIGGGIVEVHTPRLPTMSLDYETFRSLETGIVQFQLEAAIKLRTGTDLQFGSLPVKAGNVAANYPGLYSLWLRKVSDEDWRLVFNNLSDSWGTQHDPTADLGEVPLLHSLTDSPNETLQVKIEPAGTGGLLRFTWGGHAWSVPFTALGPQPAEP